MGTLKRLHRKTPQTAGIGPQIIRNPHLFVLNHAVKSPDYSNSYETCLRARVLKDRKNDTTALTRLAACTKLWHGKKIRSVLRLLTLSAALIGVSVGPAWLVWAFVAPLCAYVALVCVVTVSGVIVHAWPPACRTSRRRGKTAAAARARVWASVPRTNQAEELKQVA